MKKLTLALCAAALALTACDEIKGTNVVSQTLNVVDKKGKQVAIQPGTYRTEFKYDEKDRELKIKIKKSDSRGKDVSMKLAVPSDVELPRQNGSFALMANQIGQAWNLEGQTATRSEDSETTRTTESCSIPEEEYVCRDVCEKDEEGCEKCHEVCGYETVYYPGTQEVEYYFTTITTNYDMQFKSSSDASELAKFAAVVSNSYKHYTFTGTCYRD